MIKFDEEEYRGNLTKQIAAINKGYEYAKEISKPISDQICKRDNSRWI